MIPPDPISGFHVDQSAAGAWQAIRVVAEIRTSAPFVRPVFPQRP